MQRTQFPDDSADDTTPTDDERAAYAERQAALAEAPPTAASRPAAPPLAGLRLPSFGAAPSFPPRPSTPQPDPSLLATPGLTYERSDVTPGSEVSVRFDAPHPAYFRGTVRSCRGLFACPPSVGSCGIALDSTTRRHPRLGLVAGLRGPTQIHIRAPCHWAGEPAGHLGTESPPSRRTARPASARKTSPPCPH